MRLGNGLLLSGENVVPRASTIGLLLLGWCGALAASGVVFWFVLKDDAGGPDVPPAVPVPEVKRPAAAAVAVPRRSRAALEAEIAQLELALDAQKQLAAVQETQKAALAASVREYADLLANGAPADQEREFFRKKGDALASSVGTRRTELESLGAKLTQMRASAALTNDDLQAVLKNSAPDHTMLEILKAASAFKFQIATLECRLAAGADALAWDEAQLGALKGALTGKAEVVRAAADSLAKWRPPHQGIAVLGAQIAALKAERDSITGP
ncbi:hypothetical protein [Gemmata sp.]|uniref:hypothetical protein n=1 Tax=Gemmata sp. TaxID=1914242 RepID=UPI003F728005